MSGVYIHKVIHSCIHFILFYIFYLCNYKFPHPKRGVTIQVKRGGGSRHQVSIFHHITGEAHEEKEAEREKERRWWW